jgi:hypothetical protein
MEHLEYTVLLIDNCIISLRNYFHLILDLRMIILMYQI